MMNPQSYNLKESFPSTCNTLNLVLPRKYIENATTTRPHPPNQATQSETGSEIGRIIAWRRTAEFASDHCKRWRQRDWSLRRTQSSSTKQAVAAEPGRGRGGGGGGWCGSSWMGLRMGRMRPIKSLLDWWSGHKYAYMGPPGESIHGCHSCRHQWNSNMEILFR